VRLTVPSRRLDLGVLANQCGGLHVVRYDDADAIRLETSDMGTEYRFAYRLGDRLYFTSADGRIASVELPCGARVRFQVSRRDAISLPSERMRRPRT
jgi:hypothetical protein